MVEFRGSALVPENQHFWVVATRHRPCCFANVQQAARYANICDRDLLDLWNRHGQSLSAVFPTNTVLARARVGRVIASEHSGFHDINPDKDKWKTALVLNRVQMLPTRVPRTKGNLSVWYLDYQLARTLLYQLDSDPTCWQYTAEFGQHTPGCLPLPVQET